MLHIQNQIGILKSLIAGAAGRFLGWAGKLLPSKPSVIRLKCGAKWLAINDYLSLFLRFCLPFEEAEQAFLMKYLRNGWTILDIGAHHGFYTLLFSQNAGGEGRVIAFEPSERERKRLAEHLALNECRNVTVEPVALGDREGQAELYICDGVETGCNSLRAPLVFEKTTSVRVPVSTLDQYGLSHSLGRIDFIKLDVEGAELSVLKGGLNVLGGSDAPVMMVEIVDRRTMDWGYASRDVLALLKNLRYALFSFCRNGLLKPLQDKTEYNENILAVPAGRMAEVEPFLSPPR